MIHLVGVALVFFGNMCAVISIWLPVFRTSNSTCLFFMPNLPFLWIWFSDCRIERMSPHSHFDMIILTDFSLIIYWFFLDAFLLIWPPTTFGLIWLWPKFSYRDDWTLVSKWPRPRIDMRGRKGDFLPSVISQSDSHFSCHWDRKIWRSSSQNESHLYKWYDRSFWASKILSMGQ